MKPAKSSSNVRSGLGKSADQRPTPSATALVYSTEAGRMCPVCRQAIGACVCKAAAAAVGRSNSDGIVRVSRETKGRAGKGVTLIRGLALDDDALSAIARQLRTACGAGGTVKAGVVEIQGDHCERVLDWLRTQGHLVKRAGV